MQLILPVCDVLCVYGVPDRELEKELRRWVDEEGRYVVIFDEGEEKEFGDGRICFSHLEDEDLKKIAWKLVFLQFGFLDRCGNNTKDQGKRDALFAKIAYFKDGVHLVASDFQDRGINFIHNCKKNSEFLEEAYDGRRLFGGVKNIPAVICGAGPSLEKEIPYLRLLKDEALIFAGGTALSSLSHFGMRPHVGGVVDPHEPRERFFQHQAHEVPLFFQSRAHPKMLESMQGPLLWIPGSENDFLDEESFDGGWNVSCFLTALACHMGCNPIILVGVDLSETEDKSYAGGFSREGEERAVEISDGVLTRKDWIFARDWFAEFAKKHPEVEWKNASNGMAIEGFDLTTLKNLSFEKQEDLSGEIHSQLQRIKPGVSFDFDWKSFERVGALCTQIIGVLERIYPNPPEKNGEYVLLSVEIEKEVAYERFLLPVWKVWQHVFRRELSPDIPKGYGLELNQWLFMKGICDETRDL